jgi:hypothetical protein
MVKFVRTERGERIDQPDFQHGAETSQREALGEAVDAVLMGADAQPRTYILRGFQVSNPTGNNIRVTRDSENGRGAAVLAYREGGETKYGGVLIGGDDTKEIAIDGFANGTYGVYIRFELRDDEYQNRLFWNPNAATPTEYPRLIPTRRAPSWGLAIEQTSPGVEWTKIASVVWNGSVDPGDITDERQFFFEGSDTNGYSVTNAEWGSTDDRNVDRATYGISGLRRFVRAVQRQLQDGIGGGGIPANWFRQIPTGGFFFADGSKHLVGSIIPNPGNAFDLGDAADRYMRAIYAALYEVVGLIRPRADAGADVGTSSRRFATIYAYAADIDGDVNADLVSADDYLYTAPVARKMSINAAKAIVETPADWSLDAGDMPSTTSGNRSYTGAGGVGSNLIIPIELPNGVVVTGARWYGGAGAGAPTRAWIARFDPDALAIDSLKAGATDYDTFQNVAFSSVNELTIDEAPSVRTINNATYNYMFCLYMEAGATATLTGLVIDYTQSGPI